MQDKQITPSIKKRKRKKQTCSYLQDIQLVNIFAALFSLYSYTARLQFGNIFVVA